MTRICRKCGKEMVEDTDRPAGTGRMWMCPCGYVCGEYVVVWDTPNQSG